MWAAFPNYTIGPFPPQSPLTQKQLPRALQQAQAASGGLRLQRVAHAVLLAVACMRQHRRTAVAEMKHPALLSANNHSCCPCVTQAAAACGLSACPVRPPPVFAHATRQAKL